MQLFRNLLYVYPWKYNTKNALLFYSMNLAILSRYHINRQDTDSDVNLPIAFFDFREQQEETLFYSKIMFCFPTKCLLILHKHIIKKENHNQRIKTFLYLLVFCCLRYLCWVNDMVHRAHYKKHLWFEICMSNIEVRHLGTIGELRGSVNKN